MIFFHNSASLKRSSNHIKCLVNSSDQETMDESGMGLIARDIFMELFSLGGCKDIERILAGLIPASRRRLITCYRLLSLLMRFE